MFNQEVEDLFTLEQEFNEKVMREFGIDYDEETGYIYWFDTNSLILLKDKFIKYCEDEYPLLAANEMQLNLLENPRLMMTLVYIYIKNTIANEMVSISQDIIKGSNKGHFVLSYIKNGEITQMKSDPFINDSVRVFNFVCKLNHTEHLYDFKRYDISFKKSR